MVKLTCLHGFLGRGSDWDFLRPAFEINAPDLLAPSSSEVVSFAAWSERFVESIEPGTLLVGYSLGARLALHALISRPEHFAGGVLVGGNPGLASEEQRQTRLLADAAWAERFRHEPWEAVVGDWERQSVFAGSSPRPRPEDSYSREKLSRALLCWSLGAQEDLAGRLAGLPLPLLWVAGARDEKFAAIARQQPGEHLIVEDAGHRVPWDRPGVFVEILQTFTRERT